MYTEKEVYRDMHEEISMQRDVYRERGIKQEISRDRYADSQRKAKRQRHIVDLLQVPADRGERYTGGGMHYAIQRKTYRQRYRVDLLLTGERGIRGL